MIEERHDAGTIPAMERLGNVLCQAGVPIGAPRQPSTTLEIAMIRAALDALAPHDLDDIEAVCLRAWIDAWRQHWPSSYAREIASSAERVRLALEDRALDENRYLKLRRIAIENLAAAL